jgi:hypothetical protein
MNVGAARPWLGVLSLPWLAVLVVGAVYLVRGLANPATPDSYYTKAQARASQLSYRAQRTAKIPVAAADLLPRLASSPGSSSPSSRTSSS